MTKYSKEEIRERAKNYLELCESKNPKVLEFIGFAQMLTGLSSSDIYHRIKRLAGK